MTKRDTKTLDFPKDSTILTFYKGEIDLILSEDEEELSSDLSLTALILTHLIKTNDKEFKDFIIEKGKDLIKEV